MCFFHFQKHDEENSTCVPVRTLGIFAIPVLNQKGAQATTTATGAKTSLGSGKRVRAAPNFTTLVPFYTIYLLLKNSSGVDSKGLYLSYEKEKEIVALRSLPPEKVKLGSFTS